jgi:hypothetical protein
LHNHQFSVPPEFRAASSLIKLEQVSSIIWGLVFFPSPGRASVFCCVFLFCLPSSRSCPSSHDFHRGVILQAESGGAPIISTNGQGVFRIKSSSTRPTALTTSSGTAIIPETKGKIRNKHPDRPLVADRQALLHDSGVCVFSIWVPQQKKKKAPHCLGIGFPAARLE